jgi:uncharacterized membrane protein YGL010W
MIFEAKPSDFNQKCSDEFRKQKAASLVQTLKVQINIEKEVQIFQTKLLQVSSGVFYLICQVIRGILPEANFVKKKKKYLLVAQTARKSLRSSVSTE